MPRMSLELSDELSQFLQEMADENQSSKSAILRKAIVLMMAAQEAQKEGFKFGVAERGTQLRTEIIGL